jgi:putative addiction module antidote
MKLKITTIGNSAGVILPKELLARLRLRKGDELFALETPDGMRRARAWDRVRALTGRALAGACRRSAGAPQQPGAGGLSRQTRRRR